MTADMQRCYDEQRDMATLLLAGHPERDGLMLGLWDWQMEEVLIREEMEIRSASVAPRRRKRPG